MKRYIRSNSDFDDLAWDVMHGCKYRVFGGPLGDYVGVYDEGLAEYHSQKSGKVTCTDDPKEAIEAWFALEDRFPYDAAITADSIDSAKELCTWVVDNEQEFQQMYNAVDCPYKYEWLYNGAVKYSQRPSLAGRGDVVEPFSFG